MKRNLATSVLWNWGGAMTHLLVGFIVVRFLVRELGPTTYGLWALIGAMLGYFGVLDLGFSGSVARNLAFAQSKNDVLGVNRILNTALVILLGVAALALLAGYGVSVVFFTLFEVAADQRDAVRDAVLLMGANLALNFPFGVFAGILWSHGRFDLLNKVDIPTVILRALLSLWCLEAGGGLRALAFVTIATTLAQGFAKVLLSYYVVKELRLRPGMFDRATARDLFGFGLWFFLLNLSRTITPQLGPTLVGNRLGAATVTALRIPMQLTTCANGFLHTAGQVLTPLATAHHAREDAERQQELFLEGSKYALLLTLAFVTLFAFLGEPLITLWLGQQYAFTWSYLMVLALGELLPMSQWVGYSVILGMGKHKTMALLSLVENLTTVVLVFLLVDGWGLAGVCLAMAIPGTLARGFGQLFYCCRLVHVSAWTYFHRIFVPTVLAAVPAALGLWGATALLEIDCWWKLIVAGSVYGLVLAGTAGIGLLGWERVKSLLRKKKRPSTEDEANPDALVAAGETAS